MWLIEISIETLHSKKIKKTFHALKKVGMVGRMQVLYNRAEWAKTLVRKVICTIHSYTLDRQ